MTRQNIVVLVLGAAVFVAGAATLRSLDEPASSDTPTVLDATCTVLALADQGQPGPARVAFLDQAHDPIHELARRAAEDGQRPEAARLLEAKNVVESSSNGPSAADAQRLVGATRDALRAVDEPAPPCPAP